jgi:CheY-like chemotaxis protein
VEDPNSCAGAKTTTWPSENPDWAVCCAGVEELPMVQDWKDATVLIVDDEELVAMELCNLFKGLGFSVCGTASTAPEALRQAAELRPQLITMDINLGAAGEGIAAVTLIRTSDLTTPVLFITGASEPDAGDAIRTLGRAEYVAKPFNQADISRALAKLVADKVEAEDF